jgi:hypothetical protein
MPRKATIKKALATKERVVVKHSCTQKESIKHLLDNTNKLSVIITGNGEPDKGLCRQVAIISERQGGVLKKLDKISTDISSYHAEVLEAKNVALTAQHAIEAFKTETAAFDEGIKEKEDRDQLAADLAEKKRQDNWQRVFWIVTALLGLTGIFLNNLHTTKNSHKIDNLGTPVITNSRGMPTVLPNGDQLKMYPKDFTGDTTRVKKTGVKK